MPDLSLALAAPLYGLISLVLLAYSGNAYLLVVLCLTGHARLLRRNAADLARGSSQLPDDESWPRVTTQIPLYNELAVAARVIEAVAAMDYPAGRHDIQVLDDSTDDTRAVVGNVVTRLRARGVAITIIHRPLRSGYKAGALAEGAARTDAEFLAIFDADFVPPADFLRRTIPHLVARPDVAWVQTRWGHLNETGSLLTRAQGLGIDGHFGIDQIARASHPGFFLNFNGTGGVWRKTAIVDAGGWSADTLTEDLDLSYRAQLRGWRGLYLPDVVVPGELPADVAAFKGQQFRWAKGSIQTARKLLPAILRAPVPAGAKLQAWFHLTHYAIHPCVLAFAALSAGLALAVPAGFTGLGWFWLPVIAISIAPSVFCAVAQALLHPRWPARLLRLPLLVLAGVGLALSNSRAVLEALAGKRSAFIRTPKRGDGTAPTYRAPVTVPAPAEAVAAALCLGAFTLAAANGRAEAAQFLLIVGLGFLFIAASAAPIPRPLLRLRAAPTHATSNVQKAAPTRGQT